MPSVICNKELSITIEVDATIPILRVNNAEHNFYDIREAELLEQIIKAHPKILKYDSIIELVLKKYGIGDDEFSDPIHYIRKKKLSLCKLLSQATGIKEPEIIVNVRKVGYKFNKGWIIQENYLFESPKEAIKTSFINPTNYSEANEVWLEVRKMQELIENTIELANRLELCRVNDEEGNELLMLKREGNEENILQLSNQFTEISKTIINSLNLSPFAPQYHYLVGLLETIYSYVMMARQGEGITEETWRKLFDKELRKHYQNLISFCLISCL